MDNEEVKHDIEFLTYSVKELSLDLIELLNNDLDETSHDIYTETKLEELNQYLKVIENINEKYDIT